MTYGFMYYQNEIKWANWCIDKLKKRFLDQSGACTCIESKSLNFKEFLTQRENVL